MFLFIVLINFFILVFLKDVEKFFVYFIIGKIVVKIINLNKN